MDDLAACLRSWRDRLSPADVGLPAGGPRRAPGLRREELAMLAGLSVDYLSRLEQGRAAHPSVSVLEPLARALRLSDAERELLFRLAGHGGPARGSIRRHVTPSVQRIIDRLGDVAVMVTDAYWDVVAANALSVALLGEPEDDGPYARNTVYKHFTGAPTRVTHSDEQRRNFELDMVSDLHVTLGEHPDDERLRRLIEDTRAASPRFAELWDEHPVGRHAVAHKTIVHPEVGEIPVDCDVLTVAGSDLRLVIYTAAPQTEAASKIALVATLGLQTFSGPGPSHSS